MIGLLAIVSLILVAQGLPVQDGRCPTPGKLKTSKAMFDSFTVDTLMGEWVSYYDEIEVTQDFQCMSTKFALVTKESMDDSYGLMQMLNANALTKEFREQLKKQKDPEADQRYFINEGMLVHFKERRPIGELHQVDWKPTPSDQQEVKSPDDFIRYIQILDGDDNWLAVYSCFEIVDYKEKSTGRSISMDELQIKSSAPKEEYIKLREGERKKYFESQGKVYNPDEIKEKIEKQEKEEENKKLEEEKNEEKAKTDRFHDSSNFKDIKDLNITNEEPFSFTSETTSAEEKDKFEQLEHLLQYNINQTELTDETIQEEYEILMGLKSLIQLKTDFDQYKAHRIKMHSEYHKDKEDSENEIDMEKMNYVFNDIDVSFIHKPKFQIYVRPIQPHKIKEKSFEHLPKEQLNDLIDMFKKYTKPEYHKTIDTTYKVVPGSGMFDDDEEPCDYWAYDISSYYDKEPEKQAQEHGYNYVSNQDDIMTDLPEFEIQDKEKKVEEDKDEL